MDRYSFTGKGNLLLKAATNGVYGSTSYLKNEPIAYFTEVDISVNFSYLDKVGRQGPANLVADSNYEPSVLTVQNVKVQESLQSLLYKKQQNNTRNKTLIKSIYSDNNILFLPVSYGESLNTEIFIYNMNKERQNGYTVDFDNYTISGLANGTYTVFYSVNKLANGTYFLESPTAPYFSAEITVEGNLNGKNGEFVMHLPKLKLLTKPELDLSSQNIFVNSLEFAVIIDGNPIEVNYYG